MAEGNLLNFLLFINEYDYEDTEDMENELNHAEIDPEKSKEKILSQVKRAKAELKIEKGEKIINKYKDKIKNFIPGKITDGIIINEFAVAFRKLENNPDDDNIKEIINDAEKMEILKKIIEEENDK